MTSMTMSQRAWRRWCRTRGSVVEIVRRAFAELRSGLSYCGAKTIGEMQRNAEFIKMTSAGFIESQPHDVDLM